LYAQIGSLILATSLVQIANGFFTTLVSLRLGVTNLGPAFDGAIMSAYFVGFTIGSVTCVNIIQRIGHIRGYTAFGGIVVVATVGMSFFFHGLVWAVLRAAIGFGCVGVFVATESWLNAKAPAASRGRVFSTYMVGTFLAMAIGQLLIGRLPLESSVPFDVIVALFAAALVIVSMTRAEPPKLVPEQALPYRELSVTAPVAILGAAVSGMIGATFYAVVPAWMLISGIDQQTIGLVMLCAVLGGLAFQIPVGWLSDRMDRRILLCALSAGSAAVAVALAVLPHTIPIVLPLATVLGGCMSTFYPVSMSHAMDRMEGERIVAVSGWLIRIFGIGSMFGPITGSWIMGFLDIDGVLYFMAATGAFLAIATLVRITIRAPAPHPVEAPYVIVAPQAMQVVPEAVAPAAPR
jgi:MFS family permease